MLWEVLHIAFIIARARCRLTRQLFLRKEWFVYLQEITQLAIFGAKIGSIDQGHETQKRRKKC